MGQLQILKASAGSGKTFMLAYEYVKNVIKDPFCYKNILAVTFTKKATGEMKRRILDELFNLTQKNENRDFLDKLIIEEGLSDSDIRSKANIALTLILHDYSNFSVMTIDAFFQKIVRSFIKELHLESDYTIDFNINYLLNLAIDNLINKSESDKELKSWLEAIVDDNIEASKGVDIKKNILPLSKMILGDEFDKSYFEKHRNELINFFNHLSEKEKSLRENISAQATSFLDYCNQNAISVQDLPGKSTGIFSYMTKVSKGLITKCSAKIAENIDPDKKWAKLSQSDTTALRDIFTTLKYTIDKELTLLNSISAVLNSHRTFVLLADISRELYEICSNENKMILSNSNYLINKLVRDNDAPYIYEKIGNNYQIIMIDEFQDTSTGQWENFKPLLANSLSESDLDQATVTLVGDVKQSIYRWRGGDWRILGGGVDSAFYGAMIKKQNLLTNFRSREEVIRFNNMVIRKCVDALNESLNALISSFCEDGKISYATKCEYQDIIHKAYEGMEQEFPENGKKGGYVEVIKYDNELNLDETVRIIKDLQDRGYKAKDIAILVRSKAAAKKITSYILDYKRNNSDEASRYCFDIIASDGLSLKRSTVVKFIMSVYGLSEREMPTTLAIYNRYLGNKLTEPLSDEARMFIVSLQHLPAIESFEKISEHYKLGENSNNIAYLQAFHSAVINFSGSQTADIASLLKWWETEGENLTVSLPEGQNAIKIETIHKSKGLQYNVVIIPFCNWNLPPMAIDNYMWAKSENSYIELPNGKDQKIIVSYRKDLEDSFFCKSYLNETVMTSIENFNIFYVALTRAKSELYLMIPSQIRSQSISSYLEEALCGDTIYGEKMVNSQNEIKSSAIYIDKFKHCDATSRIELHTESDKFFIDMEENSQAAESGVDARGKGILLHKIFEQTERLEDLPSNIDKLLASGYISLQESEKLKNTCAEALLNPIVTNWFSDKWEVRSESSILIPSLDEGSMLSTKRPDKVLISGTDAIVIDYKFGSERPSHRKQIILYKELLKSMNYVNVIGYLWYINDNYIAEI